MFVTGASAFADFLAQTGAVAGGATGWGLAIGLLAGSIAVDFGVTADRWDIASKGAAVGAVFGVSFALAEALGG